jgi:hypothetical protein
MTHEEDPSLFAGRLRVEPYRLSQRFPFSVVRLSDRYLSVIDLQVEVREKRGLYIPNRLLGADFPGRQDVDFVDLATGTRHNADRNDPGQAPE